MPDFAVLLPAAGLSTRFGASKSKLLADLAGKPVLAWTLDAFAYRSDVLQIVIATFDPGAVQECVNSLKLAARSKVTFCPGGTCRAGSVGVAATNVSPEIEWIAVHDAARPLISQALIDRTFAAAVEHGAAAAALPVHLTIKIATGSPPMVQRTVPRRDLWAMQTPQVMRRADFLDAFAKCPIPLTDVTDDIQFLELAGKPVWLVEGEDRNIKITVPQDLHIARSICTNL